MISRDMTLALAAGVGLFLAADWNQFRGPASNTAVDGPAPPIRFDENIAWKAELPGRGVSGAIVVAGRVFVTSSSGVKQDRLHVLCYDSASGRPLWHRQFWATGRTLTHATSAVAAPTPASDGQRVFAFFSSNDLICLDLDGNLVWYRGLAYDHSKAGNDVGMASSPLVLGTTVVVQIENQGDSFAAGLETETGKTRWQIPRDQRANWSSPVALRGDKGRPDLVLLQAPGGMTAHEPETGRLAWEFKQPCDGITSAVALKDRVYVPSNGITALDVSSGTSSPGVLWESPKLRSGAASPVVIGDRIFTANRGGILTCVDVATGESPWQLRLTGAFWSTPFAVGGHIYAINQDGVMQVVRPDEKEGVVVATSRLGEQVMSTAAVADGAIYIRGERHLYKIAAP